MRRNMMIGLQVEMTGLLETESTEWQHRDLTTLSSGIDYTRLYTTVNLKVRHDRLNALFQRAL